MTEAKPTPGPYHRDGHCLSTVLRLVCDRSDPRAKHICGDYEVVARCTAATWDRDSKIILDALNVHHETGLTPRQLAAQRDELLAVARVFLGHDDRFQIAIGGNPIAVDKMLDAARAAIAKAEGMACQ